MKTKVTKDKNAVAKALNKSAVSRYIQLASLFKKRIADGEWQIDERIPTVEQLAKECGVAVMTIRQALDILEEDGLIERFRAKGTFVRQAPFTDLWCEVETDWKGLLLSREGAEIEILAEEKVKQLPPLGAGAVGVHAREYRHFTRVHSRASEPFLYAQVYISEKVAKKIDPKAFLTTTSMRLVSDVRGVRIAEAKQILTVETADMQLSDSLNLAIGDPIVNLLRLAVDQKGELVLVARGYYRADRVRIDMKLTS